LRERKDKIYIASNMHSHACMLILETWLGTSKSRIYN